MANIPVLPGLPVQKPLTRAIRIKRGLPISKPNVVQVVMPGSVPEVLAPSLENGSLASMRGNAPILVEAPSNPSLAFTHVVTQAAKGAEFGLLVVENMPKVETVPYNVGPIAHPIVRKRKLRRRIVRDK